MTVVPGSPSHLRPKKPPSDAIIRTASRNAGGSAGGRSPLTYAYRARHSSSLRNTSQGSSGVSRPCFVNR